MKKMKKALSSLVVLFCLTAFAQPAIESSLPVIAERGPHHRRWESVEWEPTPMGKPIARTRSYTELETGMHVKQADGSWKEASDEIVITAEGAAATNVAHPTFFAANINTAGANGTIDLTTPDGKRLRSRIFGLSYFDRSTGKAALLAEIQDSIGQL